MDGEVRREATAYAAVRFPDADLVVVGGSAAAGRRGPRSDIDLLVVGSTTMFAGTACEAAYTERWRGELFEVFASTPEAFRRHQRAGAARLRPVSAFLLIDGEPIVDRGVTGDLVAWTRALVDRGPEVAPVDLDARRYAVTNTLDDLLDATDLVDIAVTAPRLVEQTAELVLLADGRWLASGRHLLRRLRTVDAALADDLGDALVRRDVDVLERAVLRALEPLGGRLLDEYVRPTPPA